MRPWNPYKAYSRNKKYMALIQKLQNRGYKWLMGAFHAYYLMPPLRKNATPIEKAFDMGAPYYFTSNSVSFIHAQGIKREVLEVMREIYNDADFGKPDAMDKTLSNLRMA